MAKPVEGLRGILVCDTCGEPWDLHDAERAGDLRACIEVLRGQLNAARHHATTGMLPTVEDLEQAVAMRAELKK